MTILNTIAKTIDKIWEIHINMPEKRFSIDIIVDLSLITFLERCAKYITRDENMFIFAIILIDRLHEYVDVIIVQHNKYNLFGTALMIAVKTQHDRHHSNAHFARVYGLQTCQLNEFERELCKLLNFDVNVSIKLYKMYKKCLSHVNEKTNIENNVIFQ